jgi:hypothetical protein
MEISRCFAAICSAVARRLGRLSSGAGTGSTTGSGTASAGAGRFAARVGAGSARAVRRGVGSTETSSSCFALPSGFPLLWGFASTFLAGFPIPFAASGFRPAIAS